LLTKAAGLYGSPALHEAPVADKDIIHLDRARRIPSRQRDRLESGWSGVESRDGDVDVLPIPAVVEGIGGAGADRDVVRCRSLAGRGVHVLEIDGKDDGDSVRETESQLQRVEVRVIVASVLRTQKRVPV